MRAARVGRSPSPPEYPANARMSAGERSTRMRVRGQVSSIPVPPAEWPCHCGRSITPLGAVEERTVGPFTPAQIFVAVTGLLVLWYLGRLALRARGQAVYTGTCHTR